MDYSVKLYPIMSVDKRYFSDRALAVMVVCNSVNDAPLLPLVNESMNDLPSKLIFLLVLNTLSSWLVTAPVPYDVLNRNLENT